MAIFTFSYLWPFPAFLGISRTINRSPIISFTIFYGISPIISFTIFYGISPIIPFGLGTIFDFTHNWASIRSIFRSSFFHHFSIFCFRSSFFHHFSIFYFTWARFHPVGFNVPQFRFFPFYLSRSFFCHLGQFGISRIFHAGISRLRAISPIFQGPRYFTRRFQGSLGAVRPSISPTASGPEDAHSFQGPRSFRVRGISGSEVFQGYSFRYNNCYKLRKSWSIVIPCNFWGSPFVSVIHDIFLAEPFDYPLFGLTFRLSTISFALTLSGP